LGMFKKSKSTALKESAASASELASALAKDRRFRKELLSAITHGRLAQRRAARKIGFIATARRLRDDPKIRRELNKMATSLDKAWARVERKRSHKLRNSLIVLGVGGVAAAAVSRPVRKKLMRSRPKSSVGGMSPRTVEESLEVKVPVTVAYNQWTQ